MSKSEIQNFVAELFSANASNNYLLECMRASNSAIYPEPVSLEPAYEPFDATQTYRTQKDVKLTQQDKELPKQWHTEALKFSLEDEVFWQRFDALHSSLSGLNSTISYEIYVTNNKATIQVGTSNKQALSALCNVWQTYYPKTVITETQDAFNSLGTYTGDLSLVDLYCEAPYYKKIMTDNEAGLISHLLKAFSGLGSGECGFLQIIYVPAKNNWALNIKTLLKAEGALGARSPYGQTTSSEAKDASKPIYACAARIGTVTKNNDAVNRGMEAIAGLFMHQSKPLKHRTQKEYFETIGKNKTIEMLTKRTTYSSGMLLTSEELAGIAYLPDKSIIGIGIALDIAKGFKPSQRIMNGRPLGTNNATGKDLIVCLPDDSRNKCLYIAGTSQMGKSTNINHQITYLATQGHCGVGLIDPHRTTAYDLLETLPKSAKDRTIFADFDDPQYSIEYNPFDEDDPESYGRLASEAVNSLKNLFEAESFNRMSHILRMCAYALYVLKKNLSTIPTLLSKNSSEGAALRRETIEKANNVEVARFWREEYNGYKEEAFSPILNRLSALFADTHVLRIFSCTKNKLNIKHIMDKQKIVIVALPASIDSSKIIGGLLIAQIQKCALSRTAKPSTKFPDFYLFVDEFHRLTSGRILESIINETAKAGLHLCVANQETGQLSEELLMAVLSMPNIMVFNVNYLDAKRLTNVFMGKVGAEEIISLGIGEFYAKLGTEIVDAKGFPPTKKRNKNLAKSIIEESRTKYYTPIKNTQTKPARTNGPRLPEAL